MKISDAMNIGSLSYGMNFQFWPKKPVTTVSTSNTVAMLVRTFTTSLSRFETDARCASMTFDVSSRNGQDITLRRDEVTDPHQVSLQNEELADGCVVVRRLAADDHRFQELDAIAECVDDLEVLVDEGVEQRVE